MTGVRSAARPLRYAAPLVACDEVGAVWRDGVVRVTAVTRIGGDGPYLAAHFPDLRIFPGVFILEAVLQSVGQALERAGGGRDGRSLRLRAVRSLRFLVPLHPGDELHCQTDVRSAGPDGPDGLDGVAVTADCRRGDGVRVATVAVECGWSS